MTRPTARIRSSGPHLKPSYAALHPSWTLTERAFGQSASVAKRSVSFATPARPSASRRRNVRAGRTVRIRR
jgi:hypothetical protein